MAYTKVKRPAKDRFWEKVTKGNDDECWIWDAAIVNGYGHFKWEDKNEYAHRISWKINYGSIPEGMAVRHKCKNKLCVNPNHLYLENATNLKKRMLKHNY